MNTKKLLEMMLENPDTIPALVPSLVDKYKPALYAVCNEFVKMMKDYSESEYFEVKAKVAKKQFDAYVNAGFSEDQAIAFMINDNIQLMNSLKKNINSTIKNINSKK